MIRFNGTKVLGSSIAFVMLFSSAGSAWAGTGSQLGESPKCSGINWAGVGQVTSGAMLVAGLFGMVGVSFAAVTNPDGIGATFKDHGVQKFAIGSAGLLAGGTALGMFSDKKAEKREKQCTEFQAVSTRTAANEPVHAPMITAATSGVTASGR